MTPEDRIRLCHVVDEAREALKYIEGYSFADFSNDGKTARAVIRSLEVIGEAVGKLTKEYRDSHDEVPWNKIIGMRNHLIHVYFDIDYQTIWQTLQSNVPDLLKLVEKLIEDPN